VRIQKARAEGVVLHVHGAKLMTEHAAGLREA
jgi:hypothetical protein